MISDNLALSKPAYQSSYHTDGPSSNAVGMLHQRAHLSQVPAAFSSQSDQ